VGTEKEHLNREKIRQQITKGKNPPALNTRITATENNRNICVICEVSYYDEKKLGPDMPVDWMQ
jgi:hypothetical protein